MQALSDCKMLGVCASRSYILMLIHSVLGESLGLNDVVVILVHLLQLGGLHEELHHNQDHQLCRAVQITTYFKC